MEISFKVTHRIVCYYVLSILFTCSSPFYKITVPTVDTLRYDFLVHNLLQFGRPVLLVGPVGTGKTSIAQGVLQKLDPLKYNFLTINLSAQVSYTCTGLLYHVSCTCLVNNDTYTCTSTCGLLFLFLLVAFYFFMLSFLRLHPIMFKISLKEKLRKEPKVCVGCGFTGHLVYMCTGSNKYMYE